MVDWPHAAKLRDRAAVRPGTRRCTRVKTIERFGDDSRNRSFICEIADRDEQHVVRPVPCVPEIEQRVALRVIDHFRFTDYEASRKYRGAEGAFELSD